MKYNLEKNQKISEFPVTQWFDLFWLANSSRILAVEASRSLQWAVWFGGCGKVTERGLGLAEMSP